MKIKRLILFIFVLSLGTTGTNWATNYYVNSTTGNDSNSGRSTTTPFQTIQKAANTMIAGDSCFVAPGTYAERINVSKSGAANSRIVFKATGSSTITKGFTILASYITVDGFEVTQTSQTSWTDGAGFHIVGQYVNITNNYIHIAYREGIRLGTDATTSATSYCLIKGNKIIRCGQSGVLICGQSNTIDSNEIAGIVQWAVTFPASGVGASGIRFFGNGNVIRKNYIHDILLSDPENGNSPHIDAVQTWGPATNTIIEQNTMSMNEPTLNKQISMVTAQATPVNNIIFRNNVCYSTYRGINIDGVDNNSNPVSISYITIENNTFDVLVDNTIEFHNCPNLTVYNNIFYNTAEIYLDATTSSSGLAIGYNNYYNTSGTMTAGTHYTGDMFQTNPMFVNPTNRDYHLLSTSPVIDKGKAVSTVTNDMDGTTRPQGSGYDMGAYEYKSTITTVDTTTKPPADTQPPTLVSAVLNTSTSLKLTFSEKISSTGALTKSNYSISPNIKIKSVAMNSTQDGVILTTFSHKAGVLYTITVNNIKDLAGNVISPTGNKAQYQLGSLSASNSLATLNNDNTNAMPSEYELSQNYPNPFNPSTTINFTVIQNSFVSLKVYDILGKEVATLVNSALEPGSYSVNFNAANLSSGTYIYQIKANDFIMSKKMTIAK
ncbi:MAG: choice-of-anchor Q domain-containing protein [Clostridiales bacterium]